MASRHTVSDFIFWSFEFVSDFGFRISDFKSLCRAAVLVLFLACSPVFAAEAPDFFSQDSSDAPWHIQADSLSYDKKNNLCVAKGNVRLARGKRSLAADTVYVNRTTNLVDASGEVVMTVDNDILTGNRIAMNMKTGVGVIYEGKIFIAANHFYIRGNKIIKTGKETYFIDDCSLTTCDGDSPDWKITGKDLNVTIEGYGTIKHAAFYAKSVPILYIPYLVFPVKLKRQTGFLFPQFSYSERDGFEYNLPFFWAINESCDATLYENGMGQRGIKHGAEFRYALGQESRGTAMCDYLYDRQIDRGEEFDALDGYVYKGYREELDVLRLNRKRWWFRMKNDQSLGSGVRAKLDIDVVSDQDYLREFKDGYSGVERTDEYFLETFGRDIDDYTDTVRTNRLTVDKNWNRYSLNGAVLWYDNVIVRNENSSDETLQQLPAVTFTGVKQAIGDTPFFFDLGSYYKHSWRREGTRGHSVDLYPRIYSPVRFYNYFNFEPSIGLRETAWLVERYSTAEASKEKQRSREIYDVKVDLSTEFGRIFHIEGDRVDKVQHSVRPQVVYSYIPEIEQKDIIPLFVDSVEAENLLTYSITNTFTAKLIEKKDPDAPQYRYHDFCRFKLSQNYDIKEARRDVGGDRRPFSDVTAELELNPWRYISLDADAAWCPYDGEYKGYNTALRLSDYREDRITVEYRYTREDSESGIAGESIYAEAFLKIYRGLSAYLENERNLYADQDIRTVVGCLYESQCWAVGLMYSDEEEGERKYMLTVSLKGLSEFTFGMPGRGF